MLCALVAMAFSVFLDSRVVEIRSERFHSASADGTQFTVTTRLTIRVVETRPKRFINGNGSGPMTQALRILKEEWYIRFGLFDGKVTALTGDTITVRRLSGFARTFAVSPDVASKEIPLSWEVGSGHRLDQVRVGDKVSFRVVPTPRDPVVVALGIYRRPGGVIPEAEDDHLPAKFRLHNRCGAEQLVEEIVVPKLLPYLTARFLNYGASRQ